MTTHEKSAWVSVGVLILLYVPYFIDVNAHPMESLYRFWVVAMGMAVIMVLFHAIDAIIHVLQRRSGAVQLIDELDRVIQQKATTVAGAMVSSVIVVWIIVMMYALPVLGTSVVETKSDVVLTHIAWPIEQVMRAIQWLFAGFVVSNIVFYVAVIVQYRRIQREQ
jgi:hypothetical protein